MALCVADLHSNPNALKRLDARLSRMRGRVDLVLAAGDICIPGHEAYALEFVAAVRAHGVPLLLVHGNNDTLAAVKIFRREGVTIHRQERTLCGQRFVGFGGDGNATHDVERWGDELDELNLDGAILLTHVPPSIRLDLTLERIAPPPRGISLDNAPLAHLCGHIHHTEGVAYLGATKVVKLRAAMWNRCALLDLVTLHAEFVDLEPEANSKRRQVAPRNPRARGPLSAGGRRSKVERSVKTALGG